MSLGLPQDLSLIVIHNIDCLYFLIPSVYQTLQGQNKFYYDPVEGEYTYYLIFFYNTGDFLLEHQTCLQALQYKTDPGRGSMEGRGSSAYE